LHEPYNTTIGNNATLGDNNTKLDDNATPLLTTTAMMMGRRQWQGQQRRGNDIQTTIN
jgi:hypothetical protein